MNKYLIIALGFAGTIILIATQVKTGQTGQGEAMTVHQARLAALAPYAPDPGFCREVTLVGTCEKDASRARCQDVFAFCSIPIPDAGWSTAMLCFELDGGGSICPDATVLVPPKDEPRRDLADVSERRCRQAAREACDGAEIERRGQCVDEGVIACLGKTQEIARVVVSSLGEPYAITTETKTLDKLKTGKEKRPCACAPDPARVTWDAGGTACKEWQTWMGVDGGDWKKASPGHVIQADSWKGGQCEPTLCFETEAREQDPEGTVLNPLCRTLDAGT